MSEMGAEIGRERQVLGACGVEESEQIREVVEETYERLEYLHLIVLRPAPRYRATAVLVGKGMGSEEAVRESIRPNKCLLRTSALEPKKTCCSIVALSRFVGVLLERGLISAMNDFVDKHLEQVYKLSVGLLDF